MMENVGKPKGTSGVFRVEEGSSSGYSKPWENQGWNSKRYEEGFHPRYLQRGGNQVGTITNRKRKGDTIKIGLKQVIIGEGRMTMKRTTLTRVRAQNRKGVQVVPG
ncbi:hypothetical protein KY290_010822 [Solanum tuberosum]|uniref:Uncharacterized protein n=1 Tax=Solanum tuberosum TaxID=4113 RepID=A0ABQ7W0X7_SOLTU|nr:hypothetical protein KY290_010822 [Solanum tuberosum]